TPCEARPKPDPLLTFPPGNGCYPAPPMRTRRRAFRLFLVAALAVLVVGVTATIAHAIAFDDAVPCPTSGSNFICPQGSVGAGYSIALVGRGRCGPDGANL